MDSAGGGVKESWDGWEKGTCRHTAHGRTCCPTCVKNALQQVREEGERKGAERLAEAEKLIGESKDALAALQHYCKMDLDWLGEFGILPDYKEAIEQAEAALASHAEYLKGAKK